MWEEYSPCMKEQRKPKVPLELRLMMEVKDNMRGFCKYTGSESVGRLPGVAGDLVTRDTEKAEILSAFFPSLFNR